MVVQRRNIIFSFSNSSSDRRHLSGLNIFPAMEKSLSTGALDAGDVSSCGASLDNSGK